MQDCGYQTPGENVTDLKQRLTGSWNGLSQSIVDNAVDEWRKRHRDCVKSYIWTMERVHMSWRADVGGRSTVLHVEGAHVSGRRPIDCSRIWTDGRQLQQWIVPDGRPRLSEQRYHARRSATLKCTSVTISCRQTDGRPRYAMTRIVCNTDVKGHTCKRLHVSTINQPSL